MPDKPVQYDQIAHLPLGDRIDLVCDAFERERRRGLVRPLEDYVQEVPEPERDAFLSELRTVEQALSNASTVMEGEPTGSLTRPLEAPPEPTVPSQLGRYQVEELLGRGGFGEVWRCFDPELHRQVAVKVLLRERFASDQEVARFLSEARKLAQLRHPGIVAIHDVGCQGGYLFLVSEYVPGGTLHDRLQKGPLPPAEAAELLAKVAEAVHYAHKRGLVHRDLKPGNILIDAEGQPRVADFGLAVHEDEQRQRAGEVAGTPAYMAPEQVRGESHLLDGRADIWAIGVILYQMLTGRRPFSGNTRQEVFYEILNREAKPPRVVNEAIPKQLEQVVFRCLAKPINARYFTARDLANDLGGSSRRHVKGMWPRRACFVALALATTAAVALGAHWFWRLRGVISVQQLAWPTSTNSQCEVSEDRRALHVFCGGLGLLRLGTVDQDQLLNVSVDINQIARAGYTGLFLGYHTPDYRSPTSRQFLSIHFHPKTDGTLSLKIMRHTFVSNDNQNTAKALLAEVPLPGVAGDIMQLTIQIVEGRIADVSVNGASLCAALVNAGLSEKVPCQGAFGIYSFHSTCVFSAVRINGRTVALRMAGPS